MQRRVARGVRFPDVLFKGDPLGPHGDPAVAGTTVANLDTKWIGTLSTTVALHTTWIGTINSGGIGGGGGTNTVTTYGTVALPAFVDVLQVQVFS